MGSQEKKQSLIWGGEGHKNTAGRYGERIIRIFQSPMGGDHYKMAEPY